MAPPTRDHLGRLLPGHSIRTASAARQAKLHKLIDKWFGEDAEDCVAFFAGVVKGTERGKARAPGTNEDQVSAALIADTVPTIRERLDAAEVIMKYRHGLPKESLEVSGAVDINAGAPLGLDYAKLEGDELATLERLAQKALPSEPITVEGTSTQVKQP